LVVFFGVTVVLVTPPKTPVHVVVQYFASHEEVQVPGAGASAVAADKERANTIVTRTKYFMTPPLGGAYGAPIQI
jgi:hypothetical protein